MPSHFGGLHGLLAGENPLLNLGIGLLAAAGPSAAPLSRGQRIAQGFQFAQGQGSAFQQNQLARARLQKLAADRESEERRVRAAARLGEIDPRLGLLAELHPESAGRVLGGLLAPGGERERTTSLMSNVAAAGLQPGTPEYQAFIRSQLTQGGTQEQLARVQMTLAELQAEERKLNVQKGGREEEKARREERVGLIGTRNSMNLELGQIVEATALMDELQGTPLQAGVGFDERSSGMGALNLAKDFFGGDTKRASELVTKANRLTQLRNTLSMGSIEAMRKALNGRVTQMEFQVLQQGNFDPRNVRDANRKYLADRMRSILDAAEAEGVEIAGRDRYERLADELRGPGPAIEGRPMPRTPGEAAGRLQEQAESSGITPADPARRLPSAITREGLGRSLDRLDVVIDSGKAYLKNKLTGRRRPLTAAERKELGVTPGMLAVEPEEE